MKERKSKLTLQIEKCYINNQTGYLSFQFRIGPLKKAMATTVGSALRRTLLGLENTVAITSIAGSFKDRNLMREDLFELSLNLQKVHLKSAFFPYVGIARICKKGPAIITAKDLLLEDGLSVVNPHQYICTLNELSNLNLCLMIHSPGTNQGTDYIDPVQPIKGKKKSALQLRQDEIDSIIKFNQKSLVEKIESERETIESNSQIYESLNQKKISTKKYKLSTRSQKTKTKKAKKRGASKKVTITLGIPQKLALDFIMVDPIYSVLQSCGFEVFQTTLSSVNEYDELTKLGVTETQEFLRFILISRGAVEPAKTIETALQELKNTLTIFEPLPHYFLSEKGLLSIFNQVSALVHISQAREKIQKSYKVSILKNLDIEHLHLLPELELFLRREGFTNLNSILCVPLEFLRRIGLREQDILSIDKSLGLFGFSLQLHKNLSWELLPPFLSF